MLQSPNGAQKRQLDILRQRGGHALQIVLLRLQAHGLDEELVAALVGEAPDLGFDGGTVPWADALDLSGEQGRTVEVLPNDAVCLAVGVGDIAGHLIVHLCGI